MSDSGNNLRVCRHGLPKRSCGQCEAEEEVTELTAELDAANREIKRLRNGDLISREAAKAAIQRESDSIERLIDLGGHPPHYVAGWISQIDGLNRAARALDALPAADAGNLLAPEPLKAALRESLQPCGPMAVVYAEATVNAMAGIESPKDIPKEPGSAGGCDE